MIRKLSLFTVCFLALTSKNVLSMNARFAFNRPSSNALVQQIRGLNTDTTLALPAMDVITYCAIKGAKQKLATNPTALHEASMISEYMCFEDLVQESINKFNLLIAAGAHVNSQANDGGTPLHWAADYNSEYGVERLLQHGARVDIKDNVGRTALHRIDVQDKNGRINARIAEILLRHRADINAQSNFGLTLLHHAVKSQSTTMTNLLLHYNAATNIQDCFGCTPLHHACVGDVEDFYIYGFKQPSPSDMGKGNKENVKSLLAKGFFPPDDSLSSSMRLRRNSMRQSPMTLQGACLYTLLKNYDAIDKQFFIDELIPLIAYEMDIEPTHNNVFEVIVDHAPLALQRELVKRWKAVPQSESNKNKIKLLFTANWRRHVLKIKDLITLKGGLNHQTARDLAQNYNNHDIVSLLDNVAAAKTAHDLAPELQNGIDRTIKARLGIN